MKSIIFIYFLCMSGTLISQQSLDELLTRHNKNNIPYIHAITALNDSTLIFVDTRELQEYKVSHIKNALHVGFKQFNLDQTIHQIPNKNKAIVVYCSLGIRSELIARTLQTAGYTNVKNLYGGIFEWKNQNLPVYDTSGKATDSVHAYSKEWGKWLKKGTKVYE